LQERGIPFILLTNGGGKHESERVAEISEKLQIPLDPSVIVQSHSPFAELVHGAFEQEALENKCILVAGGDGDGCRQVAQRFVQTFYLRWRCRIILTCVKIRIQVCRDSW
jgi:ribonucleotide monophosphatase NagD (HAD superfamily)